MKSLSRRERNILHLIDNAKLGIVVIDQSHRAIEANQRFADMLGYSLEEVQTLHTWDWEVNVPRNEVEFTYHDISNVNISLETQHRRKDGSVFDVEVNGIGYNFGDTPDNNAILCFCNDISARKRTEQALIESERRFKSYVENAADVIFTIDTEKEVRYISPNCEKIFGYSPDELSGTQLFQYIEAGSLPAFFSKMGQITEDHPWAVCECRVRHRNGRYEWYVFRFSKTADSVTGETLFIGLAGNINEQKEYEAKLKYISLHDQLTGIYNRSYFYEAMSRLDQQNMCPVSVITYDHDGFKRVNDSYGHGAGDEVLARCANVILSLIHI